MLLLPRIPQLLLFSYLIAALHGSNPNADFLHDICQDLGSYNTNSTFHTNLNLLLSSLSSNTPITGFFNDTRGENPDKIYGLALCRGDASPSECSNCLNTASIDIAQLCPYKKGAIIYYDECLLHFSIINFFSKLGHSLDVVRRNTINVSEPERFDQLLGKMMDAISQLAAFNSSSRMFATGEINVTSSMEIYGLVQCTRDLSRDQCIQCLRDNYGYIQNCCYGIQAGAILGGSCILRYDVFPFFESAPIWTAPTPLMALPPLPSFPPPSANATITGSKKKITKTSIVVFPVVITVVLICFGCVCLRMRKASKKKHLGEDIQDITSKKSLSFDLATLKDATNNFSNGNKIGEGGFGSVYKGILSNGQEIAVKRLSRSSGQGLTELRNEVVSIAKLQHKNLVRFLGCCLEEREKLLVYEYIQNKSLDTFIFDVVKREHLEWEQRYKIIRGIAKGLLYLHEDSHVRIIHRDLKASNILLDANMNPKISDFGLARLVGEDHTQTKTNKVVGTFGYMAPEYAIHGRISTKSDVFSFGVLVLEIVSGRSNNSFYDPENVTNLLSYAWECWTNREALKLIDLSLGEHCPNHEALRCIHIGLLCVQENPSDRPSMLSVVLMLNRYKMKLQPPTRPAFIFGNTEYSDSFGDINEQPSTVSSMLFSSNKVTITEMEPR